MIRHAAIASLMALSLTAGAGPALASAEPFNAVDARVPAVAVAMAARHTYEVVSGSVNVRTGPSASNTKVASFVRGTKFTGKKRSDGWISFTTSNGKTRYLYGSSSYVKVVSSPSGSSSGSSNGDHYDIVRGVNVRSAASATSTKVGTLSVGTRVTASPSKNGYMRTTYRGRTAYYHGAYDRKVGGGSGPVVVRHVRPDKARFPDVYSRKTASSAYDVHYVPSGGMVKGVIEGSWFTLGPNLYTPMSNLTTLHAYYSSGNGRAHPSSLCNMPSAPSIYHILLSCSAVSGMSGLNRAFRARFGHDLKWGECYRTYDTQVSYKRWFGTRAATPGYSNHGKTSRQACDINGSTATYGFDSTRGKWIEANAGRYGFDRPSWADRNGLKPEFWHYEFVG